MPRHEFKPSEVEELLAKCHRRCCICHRYCGVKIEVDHIEGAGGERSGDISNAIALCFECHAEVHHYNPSHPKGRRFRPAELHRHRDEWVRLCRERPDMFVHAQPSPEAGSLERLLAELEFNWVVAHNSLPTAAFELTQFRRAIADGTFTWISDALKESIHSAYNSLLTANGALDGYNHKVHGESAIHAMVKNARAPVSAAIKALREAL